MDLMDLMDICRELEEIWGVQFPVSPIDPDGAVRLAEWANWSAKSTGDWEMKYWAFALATTIPGVEYGWGDDDWGDPVFYVQGPLGPQASAHDPFGELREALSLVNPDANRARWVHGWDGIHRQPEALQYAAQLPAIRRMYTQSQ